MIGKDQKIFVLNINSVLMISTDTMSPGLFLFCLNNLDTDEMKKRKTKKKKNSALDLLYTLVEMKTIRKYRRTDFKKSKRIKTNRSCSLCC